MDINTVPKGVNTVPKETNTVPKEINTAPKDINNVSKDINHVPKDINTVPMSTYISSNFSRWDLGDPAYPISTMVGFLLFGSVCLK